jgi:hypothetical protein
VGAPLDPDRFCRALSPRLVGSLVLFCGDRAVAEELATGTSHVTTLPFGGATYGTAPTRRDAQALLRSPAGTATACVPPTIQPSGRTGPCSFRF